MRSRNSVPETFYSILSSVFLTTESHEKRMRVADQCVCVSLTVSRSGYFQSLNPYKSAPSPGFSIFYIPGEEGKAKFYNLPDFFFYSLSDSFPKCQMKTQQRWAMCTAPPTAFQAGKIHLISITEILRYL